MFAGKKSAQIREILISESAWEEMTCLFAPSLGAVLISALIIKILTFLNNQDLSDLYKILTRNNNGRPNGK
ncbi:hypothetical protein HV252_14710 [Klebsiella grimontii]|nr:hypothetical protein HV252_14710 [Klebsiella grimontii]